MDTKLITRRVVDNLYLIRQIDMDTKFFESIWEIPEGIVYNSYVLLTSEGVVVFDTVKKNYCSEFIDTVRNIVDLNSIKYIISHHGEPDHSGCVKELSDKTNGLVIGHQLLGRQLSSFYGLNRFKSVGDNDSIKIGEYTIVFHHTPWLHWPETMVSYIIEKKYLFTCDIFGSYGSFVNEVFYDELSSDKRREYINLAKKYFANIIGFYREWVVKNLDKTASRGIDPYVVFPGHGLALRSDSISLFNKLYREWSIGKSIDNKITIIYTSMYGFVENTVESIVNKLRENGIEPVVFGFNNRSRSNISDIISEAYDSKTVLIATSAYDATVFPIAKLVTELLARKIPSNKNIIVLIAYGWGAKVGSELVEILNRRGFNVNLYEFQASQTKEIVEKCIVSILDQNKL